MAAISRLQGLTFDQVETYIAVVETGSLTRAATRLGVGKSVVTKTIQRLEFELGSSLLARTTRRLRVTDVGLAFFERCGAVVEAMRHAAAVTNTTGSELRGSLRVAASIEYGGVVLAPILARMRAQHPELKLEIVSDDHFIDLVESGADLALRLGQLVDSSYRAIEIGRSSLWLMASPDFLAAHPLPTELPPVARMPWIGMSSLPQPLRCVIESATGGRQALSFHDGMLANTMHGCRMMCLAGAGIACLPDFAVADDVRAGRLLRIFADWASAPRPINVLFPPGKYISTAARAFVDLLKGSEPG